MTERKNGNKNAGEMKKDNSIATEQGTGGILPCGKKRAAEERTGNDRNKGKSAKNADAIMNGDKKTALHQSKVHKFDAVIVTGLSGAGKTKAIDWFEDRGYYCIDNMPPALIKNFLQLAMDSERRIEKAAFVADVRGGAFFDDLKNCIASMRARSDLNLHVLFMEASASVLVKRFNESRRNHPLNNGPATVSVIRTETERLSEIRDLSDYIIDTSKLKVSDLMQEIGRITGSGDENFLFNITSFGYKNGMPQDADTVMDVRFIPNPYYVPSLKPLTGNNKKVSSYVCKQTVTKKFLKVLFPMLEELVQAFMQEGKYHLNLAFGCTGGQHRSVTVANAVAEGLREKGYRVRLEHRELVSAKDKEGC